jgi:hypothetical protein
LEKNSDWWNTVVTMGRGVWGVQILCEVCPALEPGIWSPMEFHSITWACVNMAGTVTEWWQVDRNERSVTVFGPTLYSLCHEFEIPSRYHIFWCEVRSSYESVTAFLHVAVILG